VTQSSPHLVSFLPSATEIIYALGRGADLFGRSYACDYPGDTGRLAVIVRSLIDPENMTPREIDTKVNEAAEDGRSLHEIDAELLLEAKPDLIFAQELCDVCAPSPSVIKEAQKFLDREGQVVYLNPLNLEGIFESILVVGNALDETAAAKKLVEDLRSKIESVQEIIAGEPRRKVFMLEHPDPPFCSGHWVPDQVDAAGGTEVFGRSGKKSIRVTWQNVAEKDPDIIVIAGCGYKMKDLPAAITALSVIPEWNDLRAVREGGVIGVDGDSFFARPGPRVVDGIRILAHCLFPEKVSWGEPAVNRRLVSGS